MTRKISVSSLSELADCFCCGAPYCALSLGAHRLNCLFKGASRWKWKDCSGELIIPNLSQHRCDYPRVNSFCGAGPRTRNTAPVARTRLGIW